MARQNIRTGRLMPNVGGVVQNRSETFLNPSEAVDIINMHATEEGSWSADQAGYSVVNSGGTAYEGGAALQGMVWYTDSNLTDSLLIALNGKLKAVNVSTGVDTVVDASAGYSGNVSFKALNNVLFSCDGNIATPRKWNGTTAGNSAGWPVSDGVNSFSKPRFVEEHQGRLVYASFDGFPSHLIVSNLNAGETFTLPATAANHAAVIQIGVGDGQRIQGVRAMHIPATNDTQLVIFKDRGTYALTGASPLATDEDGFAVVKVNGNYGAFNNRCIVQVGNDLLAMNEYGIISYSTLNQSGTLQPTAINSDLVKRSLGTLNLDAKDQCWAIHLPERREVWFGIPTGASTVVNEFLVFKYPSPGDGSTVAKWSRRTDAGVFRPTCGVLFKKQFYVGFSNGLLGWMFNASTYNGTGIPWRYEFPFWDGGNEKVTKRLLDGDVHFKVRSNQTMTLEIRWKGGGNNNVFAQTLALNTTVSGATYGTGVYGTSVYGSQEELKLPYRAPGNGQRLKHTLSGTTTTTGPVFLGLTPVLEMGNASRQWN